MGTLLAREQLDMLGETFCQYLHLSEVPEGGPDGLVGDLDNGAHFGGNFLF